MQRKARELGARYKRELGDGKGKVCPETFTMAKDPKFTLLGKYFVVNKIRKI